MIKLDSKFYGEIRKAKDNSVVGDDEWMVFLAQDTAFALTLPVYKLFCLALGADPAHIAAVDRTIDRLDAWRDAHQDRCKIPDAAGERLLDQ